VGSSLEGRRCTTRAGISSTAAALRHNGRDPTQPLTILPGLLMKRTFRYFDEALGVTRRCTCQVEASPAGLRHEGAVGIDDGRRASSVPAEGRLDRIWLVATRASRHPALATYLPAADGPYRA
jgi:hypothetical protein